MIPHKWRFAYTERDLCFHTFCLTFASNLAMTRKCRASVKTMTHGLNGWTFGNFQHPISFIPLVSHISSASPKKMFSQLDELKRSSALCRMSCPLSRRTSGLLRWYRHWECGFLSRPASFSSANRFLHNERYVTTGECFGPSLLSKISRRCTLLKVESLKDFIDIKKVSNSFLSKCP